MFWNFSNLCTIWPLSWLVLGVSPSLRNSSSVSGSTTRRRTSSPPSLMSATTSECLRPAMFTPFTWDEETDRFRIKRDSKGNFVEEKRSSVRTQISHNKSRRYSKSCQQQIYDLSRREFICMNSFPVFALFLTAQVEAHICTSNLPHSKNSHLNIQKTWNDRNYLWRGSFVFQFGLSPINGGSEGPVTLLYPTTRECISIFSIFMICWDCASQHGKFPDLQVFTLTAALGRQFSLVDVCGFVCVPFSLHLHESVSRPDVCTISSWARVHHTHKLSMLCLVTMQFQAIAMLPL